MSTSDAPLSHLLASSLMSVRNLSVAITGGSSGLGLYAAQVLALNGARVYIIGRDGDRLASAVATLASSSTCTNEEEGQGRLIPIQADITDKASLAAAAASIAAQEEGGGLDVLLCNAGIGGRLLQSYGTSGVNTSAETFDQMIDEYNSFTFVEAQRILDVNILGTYFTALAFLPLLKRRADAYLEKVGGDRAKVEYSPQVIVTSSNAAWAKTPILNPLYNVSKTAVSQLAKMLSTLLAESGVRVNTLEPGLYPSDLTSSEPRDSTTGHRTLSHTNGADIPAGRCGRPAEHASTILYLVSRSGIFANGATLRIDGGALQRLPASD